MAKLLSLLLHLISQPELRNQWFSDETINELITQYFPTYSDRISNRKIKYLLKLSDKHSQDNQTTFWESNDRYIKNKKHTFYFFYLKTKVQNTPTVLKTHEEWENAFLFNNIYCISRNRVEEIRSSVAKLETPETIDPDILNPI